MKEINKYHPMFKNEVTRHPLYRVWCGMKWRCNKNTKIGTEYWGQRGITVCDEWKDSFMVFCNWAIKAGYKKGLTLDRINNDGNYEPNNCRFTTWSVQNSNKRPSQRMQRR